MPTRLFFALPALLFALVAAAAFVTSGSAVALSNITVNTTDDELNGDGDCSLREAIQSANTDTAVDGWCATPGG